MRDFPEFRGPMVEWPHVELVEHALEALALLRKSWMLALATNAVASNEAEIWAALRRVRLNEFLDKVYCFRTIGRKKPSAEFFGYVLNDLGLDRSRVFMVGDDFEADVIGAVRCGIRAVWFNNHSTEARETEMYTTIRDLRLLPETLTRLAV